MRQFIYGYNRSKFVHMTRMVLPRFTSYINVRESYKHVDNETSLLRRARAYDEDALSAIYDQYAPMIYAYLYRRVQDAQLAEDLTSEVFLRMLQAIRAEKGWKTSFRAWLYRIAHNLVVDHYRKQPPAPDLALREELTAAQSTLDSVISERLSRQRLWAAISSLTPDQQHVIALRFGQHVTSQEIAEVMDKSVSAVESLQHRALAALRRMLERE
ncbi:MAG: sigma-70 family RNA polymerase sigma factor [Anaerolineae bacterium]|nr:sigma-70 family RNA polymerase sigma factor [Anaerolineae bacterium]